MNVAEAFDPVNAPAPQDDAQRICRKCGGASRNVTSKTVLLKLKLEHFDRVGESEYRFCSDPECRMVYFTESDSKTFTTGEMRVRVSLKEQDNPIPLCYCFGFEERDVREEISRTATSTIPQRIAVLIKQKMCACPARNPSGACCLGEGNKANQRLLAEALEVG